MWRAFESGHGRDYHRPTESSLLRGRASFSLPLGGEEDDDDEEDEDEEVEGAGFCVDGRDSS